MPISSIGIYHATESEKVQFIIQEFLENTDDLQKTSMDGVATYFNNAHNIKFDREFWEASLWPCLCSMNRLINDNSDCYL